MTGSAFPKPPQPAYEWRHGADEITAKVDSAIRKSRNNLDAIAALSPEQCTFASVCEALARDEAELGSETSPLSFYSSVSTSKHVRDAASAADNLLSQYGIDSNVRQDIYDALKHAQANTDSESLSPEQRRLFDKFLLDKQRAGLALPLDKREQMTNLKKKISELCVAFRKNCDEDTSTIQFTKQELDGVPQDVISGYTASSDNPDKLVVTFKTPDIVPVFRYAKSQETRRRAHVGYETRLAVNAPIFAEIMSLRRKCASVMGYKTWADYIIEPKMAKTADAALAFLDDLHTKLKHVGELEAQRLLKLLPESERTEHLAIWDYRYLDRQYTEETLSLDDEEVKKYFPAAKVVEKILDIYQELMQVSCVLTPAEDTKVWHEEVSQFAVYDMTTKEFLGWLLLDLYPREGKYGHAAVWGLLPGYQKTANDRQYPVAAMVANLAKPTAESPGLMRHDDVVTFFHEMGHAFHQLCSKTTYSRFHGTRVSRDFVEAPSQMLENWCWTSKVLGMISSHYQTSEPLPQELIDRIIESRNINQGLFNLRQLFFGKYDLFVHTSQDEDIDYTKLWCDLRKEISLVDFDGEYCPGQGSFAHLCGGYDGGYYGYLFSQVYSADMFATVFASDPLNPKSGLHYRKEILLPGGSRDEMDSLVEFLGREPNNEAFLKQLLSGAPKE